MNDFLAGRYRLTRKLGEGGMGVVFAGLDERLGRPVAIKMLRHASPSARERMWREARAAASVSHPNVCQLYEIGEAAGDLFLAMELLEGEPLASRLTRGPLPLTDALPVALAVLGALSALHAHGIVHRDLKPSNVFMTPHAVKLLDFGLARSADDDAETRAALTLAGTLLGTPRYMSPEQASGGPIDARSDLFAAGILMYEMLTGRPPFDGGNPMQVLHAIMYDDAPALVGSAAVAAVDRVIHRAIAKAPGARYDTAEAMAADLRFASELADSGDVPQVRAMTRLIVLPFRVLRPDGDTDFLAFSLPDALAVSLASLESLVVKSSLAAARFASGAPDLREIAREAGIDMVLSGTLLRAGDQLRVTAQLAEAAAGTLVWSHTAQAPLGDVFHLQDALVERIVASLALPLTAREQRRLKRDAPASAKAYEFYLRANQIAQGARVSTDVATWTVARDLYLRALEEDPQFAPAWAGVGRVYRVMAKSIPELTGEYTNRAEAAYARALELNPDLAVAHNLYAQLETDLGRGRDAMARLLKRARTRGSDPELFAGLCHACRYCGLLEASVAAHERAMRLDPTIVTSVAHTYFALGDNDRVIDQCERVMHGYGYIGQLALATVGRQADAVTAAAQMEQTAPPQFRGLLAAARWLIEGKTDDSFSALDAVVDGLADPEALFYAGRHFARLGRTRRSLEVLERVFDGGYCGYLPMTRDPWFDAVRDDPAFLQMLRRHEDRYQAGVAAFHEAAGPAVLGALSG